jgi:hypothetical protein
MELAARTPQQLAQSVRTNTLFSHITTSPIRPLSAMFLILYALGLLVLFGLVLVAQAIVKTSKTKKK